MDSYVAAATAWVDHLRGGGTDPWRTWRERVRAGAPESGATGEGLPGAQSLELMRRLNLAGSPSRDLVDRVLRTPPPGRGRPELALDGLGGDFGPAPVEPADLPPGELLRVAVRLLVDEVAESPLPAVQASPLRRMRGRGVSYRIGGDTWHSGRIRDTLTDRGRPPGGSDPVAVVFGADLLTMAADVWTYRCCRDGTRTWERWLTHLRDADRIPPRADLARSLRHWRDRFGAERVHLVLEDGWDDPRLRRLWGSTPPSPTRLSHAAAEVARRVRPGLASRLSDEPRRLRQRRLLVPRLVAAEAGVRGAGPELHAELPDRVRDWFAARAEERAAAVQRMLTEESYSVHGDPTRLRTLPAPRPHGAGSGGTDEAVLRVAIRALLTPGSDAAARSTSRHREERTA